MNDRLWFVHLLDMIGDHIFSRHVEIIAPAAFMETKLVTLILGQIMFSFIVAAEASFSHSRDTPLCP